MAPGLWTLKGTITFGTREVKWPNAGEGEHQYGFSIFNSEPISGNYTCIIPVPAELNLSYIYHHQVMVMGDLNPDHMELASGKLGESPATVGSKFHQLGCSDTTAADRDCKIRTMKYKNSHHEV